MKKFIPTILSIVLGAMIFTGCTNVEKASTENKNTVVAKEVNIITPDGLPTIAISKLAK